MSREPSPFAAEPADGALTRRQVEILALLRDGKANKDIANALGIGLGTVKQHMVALFRKLKVTNRAMAVSRGFALGQSAPGSEEPLNAYRAERTDGHIELRPSSVLSLAITPSENDPAERNALWLILRRVVSDATAERDCTMVARPDNAVDIIFGLNRVHEDDSLQAIGTARAIFAGLMAEVARANLSPPRLHGGLASGYLLASMHPRGGWTGETVAGHLIVRAREIRDEAPPSALALDPQSRRLMAFARRADGVVISADDPPLPLYTRESHNDLPPPPPARRIGRDNEFRELQRHLDRLRQRIGAVIWIEGEAGMGKTTLGRAFQERCRADGVRCIELRCGERPLADQLAKLAAGSAAALAAQPAAMALNALRATLRGAPLLLMVDDMHLAVHADVDLITTLIAEAESGPLLLLGVGRSRRDPRLAALAPAAVVRLARMPHQDIEQIVLTECRGGLPPRIRDGIVDLAFGVPLFAVELTRAALATLPRGREVPPPPITLAVLVSSRLDVQAVDRRLLRWLAHQGPTAEAQIALHAPLPGIAAALEQAIKLGLLRRDEQGNIDFAHPLVREVIRRTAIIDGSSLEPEAEVAGSATGKGGASPKRTAPPQKRKTTLKRLAGRKA